MLTLVTRQSPEAQPSHIYVRYMFAVCYLPHLYILLCIKVSAKLSQVTRVDMVCTKFCCKDTLASHLNST